MPLIELSVTLLALSLAQNPPPKKAFWDIWGDGLAEVSAYQLTQPRYGELRQGNAVLIYVADPFTRSTRVKPDPGKHPESDVLYVLKLNHLRTFQTGVYPYRLMTSVFAHVDPEGKRPRGSPSKVSFSSQEWCGTTHEELLFDQDAIRERTLSYFDLESGDRKLPYPADGLVGDTVFITLRGIFGHLVEPGKARTLPFLPTATEARLLHKPLKWTEAVVRRSAEPSSVRVPAGTFRVESFTLSSEGRAALTVLVEADFPHRIIRWEGSDGERAELLGSKRMKYWELNHNANEGVLKELGL